AMKVREFLLKKSLDVGVINARFIKPLDEKLLLSAGKKNKPVITLEDNTLTGGFGTAVDSLFIENGIVDLKILNLGLPDKFIEHGTLDELFKLLNLDDESISKQVISFLNLK
ncbi:MAG: transketolase C-terminal domain-containing protein, partial [bacterium]|nr:transketolase C-terminal domain-containing protein [bacterium]